jgi:hypothetical protein
MAGLPLENRHEAHQSPVPARFRFFTGCPNRGGEVKPLDSRVDHLLTYHVGPSGTDPVGLRRELKSNLSRDSSMADPNLKRLMKNLEESINEALSESSGINEAIREIKDSGYEVVLVVDATIGFKPGGKESDGSDAGDIAEEPVRLRITPEDAKFLKSLKISVDKDA